MLLSSLLPSSSLGGRCKDGGSKLAILLQNQMARYARKSLATKPSKKKEQHRHAGGRGGGGKVCQLDTPPSLRAGPKLGLCVCIRLGKDLIESTLVLIDIIPLGGVAFIKKKGGG